MRHALFGAALLFVTHSAMARDIQRVDATTAIRAAHERSTDLRVARERQGVARAEVDVARILPNPTLAAGTSTQAARLSVTAGIALPILGQRGAAIEASRADAETVGVESQLAWTEARAGVSRAYVDLWLAQERATARREAREIAVRIDDAVAGRVEVGASPEIDGLRTRAERLRAEADEQEAFALVSAASSQLEFFLVENERELRADGEYPIPHDPPALGDIVAKLDGSPAVRRENADAHAADSRAEREKALARPTPIVEVGIDVGDPTERTTNYRGQLGFEIPLLSARGAQIGRERALASAARARAATTSLRARADLTSAYFTYVATDTRVKALRDGVLVAATAAARATEESYGLGRAPLVAVLDAARARLDARLALAEATATRAQAWVEIERIVGQP